MKCYSAKYLGDPVGRRPVTTHYWARNATSMSSDPETTYTFEANQNFIGLGFEISDLGKRDQRVFNETESATCDCCLQTARLHKTERINSLSLAIKEVYGLQLK